MSTSLSDSFLVLSVIFSAIAATVSALTLWFTSLKGPDIDLVSMPNTKTYTEDIRLERFMEYIPFWFELEPIELVFANSGSRAGVITGLKLDFKPSSGFEPFFRELITQLKRELPKVEQTDYAASLPVSIREGDNCILKAGGTIYTVKWKDPEFENIPEGSNIRVLVEDALKANRRKLEQFLNFLYSGKPIGSFTLDVTYTYRSWFGIKLKTKQLLGSIEVVNSFKDALKGWENCLREWDDRRSRREDFSKEILEVPKMFSDILKTILDQLIKFVERGELNQLPTFDDRLRDFNQKPEIKRFALEREKGVIFQLKSLNNKINEFNQEVAAASTFLHEKIEATRMTRLKSLGTQIKELVTERISELEKIRQKLANELFP